jgi:pyruvate dehydrogenase E2 component (dihydrolipoamide acetyltransferase)
VTINQIIVDIETAKAVVELPSPFEGVVAALLVPEGVTADVGTPIISVDEPGRRRCRRGPKRRRCSARARRPRPTLSPRSRAAAATEAGASRDHGTLAPKPERQAVLVGYGSSWRHRAAPARLPRRAAGAARPARKQRPYR